MLKTLMASTNKHHSILMMSMLMNHNVNRFPHHSVAKDKPDVWPFIQPEYDQNFWKKYQPKISTLDSGTRPYADRSIVDPSVLHKNAIPNGYKPVNDNVHFAYPSIMYPPDFEPWYTGFVELTKKDFTDEPGNTVMDIQCCPFETGKRGIFGWWQIGESLCTDLVVMTEDPETETTYVLMGWKKICEDQRMRVICGGGLLDPGLNIFENMNKELGEEAGLKDFNILEYIIENAFCVYTGPLPSPRSSHNSYSTTMAYGVTIPWDLATSLDLQNVPDEDCNHPHWYSYNEMVEEEQEAEQYYANNPKLAREHDFLPAPISVPYGHRLFLHLAINTHPLMRYVHFPCVAWSNYQLSKFRSCMNNLEYTPVILDWTNDEECTDQRFFMAGPTDFDRVDLFHRINDMVKQRFDEDMNENLIKKNPPNQILFIDPINRKMNKENKPWLNKLEHYYLDDPTTNVVFVIPNNLVPNSTFEKMRRVVKNNKTNVFVFVQNGTSEDIIEQIPENLQIITQFYDDDDDLAAQLYPCFFLV